MKCNAIPPFFGGNLCCYQFRIIYGYLRWTNKIKYPGSVLKRIKLVIIILYDYDLYHK